MSNPQFEHWRMRDVPNGIRRGQHLMNTAPNHIYHYATGTLGFDCFYEIDPTAPVIQRFIMLAELCWHEMSEEDMNLARKMILEEIPL